jgi:hypothetical protein
LVFDILIESLLALKNGKWSLEYGAEGGWFALAGQKNANVNAVPRVLPLGYDGRSLSG